MSEIRAQSQGADDRCGLVLEVFEELWNTDEGLNDGVVELGVDIDPALVPNAAERAGIAWRFGSCAACRTLYRAPGKSWQSRDTSKKRG